MTLIIVVALFGIAYFLLETGLPFFAMLAFLLAILQAFTGSKEKTAAVAAAATPKQRPIIVTTAGGKIPKLMKVVIKNPWPGTTLYEDFQMYLGGVVQWPFRLLIRILTGRGGKVDEPGSGGH